MSYPLNRIQHTVPVQPGSGKIHLPGKSPAAGSSFKSVFDEKLRESAQIKFSAHAQERLRSRNISLDQTSFNRLEQGMQQLMQKGGRESLILLDQSAFLVNVQNRTVITAIGNESLKNNVFTNIDSAIIV